MNRRQLIINSLALFPVLALSGRVGKHSANSETRPLTILFQGDSITDGNRGRNADPNHIMGHGYAFSIASHLGAAFPQAGLKFYNRGISGNKVTDLRARWKADTIDLKPDVLSLLVGINDVAGALERPNENLTADEFANVYDDLLRQAKDSNPDIILILGLPFAYPVGKLKPRWPEWKALVESWTVVIRQLAAKHSALVADYPAAFDDAIKKAPAEYWIWDGIHPTVAGHEIMAREWLMKVRKRLPFLEQASTR